MEREETFLKLLCQSITLLGSQVCSAVPGQVAAAVLAARLCLIFPSDYFHPCNFFTGTISLRMFPLRGTKREQLQGGTIMACLRQWEAKA